VLVCACLLEPATCHKNHQSRQQTANSITDHLTIIPFMYLIIMLLNLIHSINLSHHYLLLLLPQFSLNLSPQNLKRAQQSCMVSQIATGGNTDGRCFGIDRTKQQQLMATYRLRVPGWLPEPSLVRPTGQK
jgi:hypothetical protein